MRSERLPSSTSRRLYRRSLRARGFTLVEVLVTLGIIVLLVSIVTPAIVVARRHAARNREARDLEALRMGLEEYKNNFNEYPPIGLGGSTNGQQALYCALVGRTQTNTINNAPLSNSKSGRPAPALINVENFRAKFVTAADKWLILDGNDKPYLYFRATVPTPDIRNPVLKGFLLNGPPVPGKPSPLYNFADCTPLNTNGTFQFAHFQQLMGDENKNNVIDPAETPSTTGQFILWGAATDAVYGLDPSGKCDDVTNFPLPPKYQK